MRTMGLGGKIQSLSPFVNVPVPPTKIGLLEVTVPGVTMLLSTMIENGWRMVCGTSRKKKKTTMTFGKAARMVLIACVRLVSSPSNLRMTSAVDGIDSENITINCILQVPCTDCVRESRIRSCNRKETFRVRFNRIEWLTGY